MGIMDKIYCKTGDFIVQIQPFSCPPAPKRFVLRCVTDYGCESRTIWKSGILQSYMSNCNMQDFHMIFQKKIFPDVPWFGSFKHADLAPETLILFKDGFRVNILSATNIDTSSTWKLGDWKISLSFWKGFLVGPKSQVLVLGRIFGWSDSEVAANPFLGFFVGVGGWGFVCLEISFFLHLETLRDHPSRYVWVTMFFKAESHFASQFGMECWDIFYFWCWQRKCNSFETEKHNAWNLSSQICFFCKAKKGYHSSHLSIFDLDDLTEI